METRDEIRRGLSVSFGLLVHPRQGITAPATLRFLVLAASFSLLSAPALLLGDDSPVDSKPAVRYEPFGIISPWGAPVLRGELGRFRVLENRKSGALREIELAFVRIPSVAQRPGPPIVWLSGGPGRSGTADLDTPVLRLFLELRRLGDVLVLDQRGTGLSVPRLDCPGTFQFPKGVPLDRARAVNGLEAAARACVDRWRAEGVDLTAYNTEESAEDIEELRIVVGAAKLRLLAGSYGTHLALAAIRAHEDRLDRAVLIGVVGPDHLRRSPADADAQLAEIARLVHRDRGLASRTPDLLKTIRGVRDRLGERPVTVEVQTREGGRFSVVTGRFDLEWYARSLLSSREGIAHLPALVAAMEAGNFTELGEAAARWRSARAPAASIFTMRCASGASPERALRIESERERATLGDATDFAEEGVCRAWGVAPLPEAFRVPVRSAMPALFVSGSLDGDTPEANAAEVLRGFAKGEHLLVEGAAHALLGFEEAASREAIARFFEGERLRTSRVGMSPLAFEGPESLRRRASGLLARVGAISVSPSFAAGP